jgi:hypothetical protein
MPNTGRIGRAMAVIGRAARFGVAFAAGSAVLAAPAGPERFRQFREGKAVVHDDDGVALYAATVPFASALTGNTGLIVYGVNAERGLVRISLPQENGLWVRCDALVPQPKLCVGAVTRTARGGGTRGVILPECPGDARCPQPGKKAR